MFESISQKSIGIFVDYSDDMYKYATQNTP